MPWTDRGIKTINPGVLNEFALSASNVSLFFIQVIGEDSLNVRKYGDLWIVATASPFGSPIGAIYEYYPIWRPYTQCRFQVTMSILGYQFKPNKAFSSTFRARFASFSA